MKGTATDFIEKWTPEIAAYNFTQVPNLLIHCQGHLGLTDGELVTLIQLMKFWYSHESRIFPSIETLTKYSGNGYSTVQRRLKNLEKKGFIKRRHRYGTSNDYDLVNLRIKLYQHQKKCPELSQKRGVSLSIMRTSPSSFSTDKEYEELKRRNSKKTENNPLNRYKNFTGLGVDII